jgi:hypothetical protein
MNRHDAVVVAADAAVPKPRLGAKVIGIFVALPLAILALGYIDRTSQLAPVEGIVTRSGEGPNSRLAPGRGFWVQVALPDGVVVTCSAPAAIPVGSRFTVSRGTSRVLGRTSNQC